MKRLLRGALAALVVCLVALWLSHTAIGQTTGSVTDVIPPIVQADFSVKVQTIAGGMVAPNYGTAAPGLPSYLFVVDQPGQLWRVDLTKPGRSNKPTLFLDVSSLLVPLGIASLGGYDERGFLGLAFSPDYATSGLFYTYTSEPATLPADFTYPQLGLDCPQPPANGLAPDHQNVVREWHVANPLSESSRPDATSRVVLVADWGNFNHDGGGMTFGPDGMLYVSLGDGGGEDDQTCQVGVDGKTTIGHSPQGNGQDPSVAYGKILRIDPSGRTSANGQYSVPTDNPFVTATGFLPEVFAYGLRNTFRFSFDGRRMWGNDVGQNDIEEVDRLSAANFGWRQKEATFLFDPSGFAITGFDSDGHPVSDSPGSPIGVVDPVAEYAHERLGQDQGHAGIGGFVYRGTAVNQLRGRYVFGDYSLDFVNPVGRLLMVDNGRVLSIINGTLSIFTLGLGRDAQGELYVMGNKSGGPSGNSGIVQRIVP